MQQVKEAQQLGIKQVGGMGACFGRFGFGHGAVLFVLLNNAMAVIVSIA
jgi:hypothetical protein